MRIALRIGLLLYPLIFIFIYIGIVLDGSINLTHARKILYLVIFALPLSVFSLIIGDNLGKSGAYANIIYSLPFIFAFVLYLYIENVTSV